MNEQLDVLARDMEKEDAGVENAGYLLFLKRHLTHVSETRYRRWRDSTPMEWPRSVPDWAGIYLVDEFRPWPSPIEVFR